MRDVRTTHHHSQTGRVIQKRPRQIELFREVGRERFDAECFGRVMPSVEHVHTKFLGNGESPMRSLASDESVHTLFGSALQFASGPAGDYANPATERGAAWNEKRLGAGGFLEAL